MDKLKLKAVILESELALLELSKQDFTIYGEEIDLDQNDVIDYDDLSRADTNASHENELRKRMNVHEQNMEIIGEISFAPSDAIKPGSVVKVNGEYFVIAIPIPPFDFDGQQIEGISANAPIYSAMRGKKQGDSFTFHDKQFTIEEVM